MKLKFKRQTFQTHAVEAVADCFAGQPKSGTIQYRVDPGRLVEAGGQAVVALEQAGFKNAELAFAPAQLLEKIHAVQVRQDLPLSGVLASNKVCAVNLDIEMETGTATLDTLKQGEAFVLRESKTDDYNASIHSAVKYDLIGKLAESTQLTRRTVAEILCGINKAVFGQYKTNPEDFMQMAGRLINEQKATSIVEHIAYDPIDDTHHLDIFTQEKPKVDFSKGFKAGRHIYDYVFTDSKNERSFVSDLDASSEVIVYAKLPRGFSIPTPVGNYNPDWAIAFQEGKVKHVFFVAETKGSMSDMELRAIEKSKIMCARKFFTRITSDEVKYDVVDSYGKLMELVK